MPRSDRNKAATTKPKQLVPQMTRLSVDVPTELMERMRDFVVWRQREGFEDTLRGLVRRYCELGLKNDQTRTGLEKIPPRKRKRLLMGRRPGG